MSTEALAHLRYETPWRRLHWTGSAALVLWALAAYGLVLLLNSVPTEVGRVPPVNARFVELPEPKVAPPPPQAAAVTRPTTPAKTAPAKALPAPKTSAPAKPAAAPSAPALTAPEAPAGNVPAGPETSEGTGSGAGKGAFIGTGTENGNGIWGSKGALPIALQEHTVGAGGRPLETMISVEDKPFDYNGTGAGVSWGGWAQEYSEACDPPPSISSCAKPRFSQQPTPMCYNGNADSPLSGSCRDDHARAVRAFKRKDYAEAFAIFKDLAEKDYAPAQFSLGAMYNDGTGVDKDEKTAAYWFRKAADQGDVKATYSLALMYDEGRGVEKDMQQAFHWYEKASYYGYSLAQANLGLMYSQGIGVDQDDKKAAYWYLKAADRGNFTSQYNLGVMYEEGKGVPKDEKQAMIWYCRGVTRGEANATERVRRMYGSDLEGVTPEEIRYFCYRFFVMFRTAPHAYEDRTLHEQLLTQEQIERVYRLDKLWRSK